MSPSLPDPDGEHAYAVRSGGSVEKLSAESGECHWEACVSTTYAAGRPALTRDAHGLLVASSAGTVYRLNAATGREIWGTQLPDEALLPMGPYRKSRPVTVSGPAVTDRSVLHGTCGGRIYRLDPASGEATVVAHLASVGDGDVVAVSTDGVVRRLRTSA